MTRTAVRMLKESGWDNFMSSTKLTGGYVVDDTIIIRADIVGSWSSQAGIVPKQCESPHPQNNTSY